MLPPTTFALYYTDLEMICETRNTKTVTTERCNKTGGEHRIRSLPVCNYPIICPDAVTRAASVPNSSVTVVS